MKDPKEKAYELIDKMHNVDITDDYQFPSMQMRHAIKCALIAVDEILEIIRYHGTDIGKHSLMFWKEVKQEIEKL